MGASEIPEDHNVPRTPETHATTTTTPGSPARAPPSGSGSTSALGAAAAWVVRQIKGPGRREATERMGLGQAAYVFGMHGVGSLVISGGINFGIACGKFLMSLRLWVGMSVRGSE